jgi:hypothetical protein
MTFVAGNILKYMSVVVTKNKFVYSVYYPQSKTLYSTYKGKPVRELALEHVRGTKKFADKHVILGSLIDLRKLFGSYFKYIDLLSDDLYPKMKESGLQVLVYVIPDDILVKNVTYKLIDETKKLELLAKIFTDFQLAEEWLKQNIQA